MKKAWTQFLLPLSEKETARLYWELSNRGAFCSGEKFPWRNEDLPEEEFLVLAILQSRYDPRLLAILIDYLKKPQSDLNPLTFKDSLRKREALSIIAVIGEFVLEQRDTPTSVRDFFHFLMSGVEPVPTQLFYQGLYPIAGRKMQEAIDRPLWFFKKWGFLASDAPLLKDKVKRRRIYLYDQKSRFNFLRELASEKKKFRLKDYLQKISFSISRQQALKDLNSTPWIKKSGRKKGTFYTATH